MVTRGSRVARALNARGIERAVARIRARDRNASAVGVGPGRGPADFDSLVELVRHLILLRPLGLID
jgi:hypothetical protein